MLGPDEDDAALLWDMLQASRAVRRFVAGRTFHAYMKDLLLRSGVERQIEIIGEAAKKISAKTKATHPNVPWRGIIAQRHVLAHEYGELEHELIWQVATEHVPELIKQLESMTPNAPGDSADPAT